VQYTKNEGAKWEEKAFDDYPLKGYQLEVRETLGRASQVYENGDLQVQSVSFFATIDMDGIASGGSSELPVNDFN
jgi:hypothetical protein